MVKLSFSEFDDYTKKLNQYLKTKNLQQKFIETELNAYKIMIDGFNIRKSSDVEQIVFLMWTYPKIFIDLLNSGYLLTKLNLKYFKRKILRNIISRNLHESRDILDLTNHCIPYYDCLKFIGQFTNSQPVYDLCLSILEAMPLTLGNFIFNPPSVMYFMNYNQNANIDTSTNKIKTKPSNERINKLYDFNHTVHHHYHGDEEQYNHSKRNMQFAYNFLINVLNDSNCEKSEKSEKSEKIEYICLANYMVHCHYHVIEDTESISTYYSEIDNQFIEKIIEELLIDINNEIICEIETEEDKSIKESIENNRIIDSELKLIDKVDYDEMIDIGIKAYIYVSDDKYHKETLKRDKLLAIYERGIAEPNSKFSHNLMREAVKCGILWLVKFLISKGVPTKNIPPYGSPIRNILGDDPYESSIRHKDSLQLNEILNQEIHDYDRIGEEWLNKKIAERNAVRSYLVENDLINSEFERIG